MKTKLLLLLFVAVSSLPNRIHACGGSNMPVYNGEIRYIVSPTDPLTCSVEVVLEYDAPQLSSTDSIMISWGDGMEGPIFSTGTAIDGYASSFHTSVYFRHYFSGSHTYASPSQSGFYSISVMNQFRVNDIANLVTDIPFMPYYIEAQVRIDTIAGVLNESPVVPDPAIAFASLTSAFQLNTFLSDPNTDSLVFSLINPMETHDSLLPGYFFPDLYCQEFGSNSPFTINASGEIDWGQPCAQGTFVVATKTSKYRNGILMGSVMSDFNIYASSDRVSSIPSYSANSPIHLYPNPANSFVQLQTDRPVALTISNALGETVRKLNIESSSAIDISDLSCGVYLIKDEKSSFVSKLVKQ
jgi:hypothetical protein